MSSAMSIPENRTLRGAVIDYTSDRKMPLNECKIYFSPVQAGEGTPSPENVREISGWDSVTVYGFNKRLPSEYCEVEYLESTGTQYFWTDVDIQDGLTVDSVQTFNGGDNYLFGGTALISEGVYSKTCFNGYYANHIQEAYSNLASNYYNFGSVSGNNNTIYHLTTYHGEGNRIIYIDGILDETNSKKVTNSISNTNEKCVCFGFSSLGNPKNFYKGKVYSLKVSKNDILLANYVPCYRISDHTPGMWDTVSQTFYTNSGTGNFILGPEVGITIDFPKTIYGGYVDLIRGEIVETHYLESLTSVNQESLADIYNTEQTVFFRCNNEFLHESFNHTVVDLMCETLNPIGSNWSSNNSTVQDATVNTIAERWGSSSAVCIRMYNSVFGIDYTNDDNAVKKQNIKLEQTLSS